MKHKNNDLDPAKVCANLIGDARKICFKPAVVRKRLGGLIYPLCKECAETLTVKAPTSTLKLEGSKQRESHK